jgi:hypothetical protein
MSIKQQGNLVPHSGLLERVSGKGRLEGKLGREAERDDWKGGWKGRLEGTLWIWVQFPLSLDEIEIQHIVSFSF